MAEVIAEMSPVLGERGACARMQFPRASFQRRQALQRSVLGIASPELVLSDGAIATVPSQLDAPGTDELPTPRAGRKSVRALSAEQRQALLDAVHEMRFIDRSVPSIYATLLDEGRYYGSMSTMYRVLHSVGEVGERRDQATRPAHVKPELCATRPNEVYAWDITKLHGPQKWTYQYLYTVIDIYSRYVVGWMVADRERSELARLLLQTTIEQQGADPQKLTIHADRGSSMKSKPVAFLLADLGVTKSHSRPHVSNDNPHIESLFKTLKYQPAFPATFSNIVEARSFCKTFFHWYNNEHRHSGIALLTPRDVHHGRAQKRITYRKRILDAAYDAHPERFVRGRPQPMQLAPASYINRPAPITDRSQQGKEGDVAF